MKWLTGQRRWKFTKTRIEGVSCNSLVSKISLQMCIFTAYDCTLRHLTSTIYCHSDIT